MVDVFPKVGDINSHWTPAQMHYSQQTSRSNSQYSYKSGHQNPVSRRSNTAPSRSSRWSGNRRGRGRSPYKVDNHQDQGSSDQRFVPAPRHSRHSQQYRDISASVLYNSVSLGERLSEFKSHPTVFPDPILRPFHGRGCKCMPLSAGLTDSGIFPILET